MKKTERRNDILRAARGVFASKGYHDAKIDDIVAAASVAKGTFYLYFRDKRSIFTEIVDTLFLRIRTAIVAVDIAGDVAAQIKHNIRATLAILLDDPETTRMMMSHAAVLDPAFAAEIDAFYASVKKLIRESLASGQELGIVAKGDTQLIATFTIGALKEVLLDLTGGGSLRSREQLVTELFDLFQGGYLRIAKLERSAADGPAVGIDRRRVGRAKSG
jgi:AcrR family transcriptional regulator